MRSGSCGSARGVSQFARMCGWRRLICADETMSVATERRRRSDASEIGETKIFFWGLRSQPVVIRSVLASSSSQLQSGSSVVADVSAIASEAGAEPGRHVTTAIRPCESISLAMHGNCIRFVTSENISGLPTWFDPNWNALKSRRQRQCGRIWDDLGCACAFEAGYGRERCPSFVEISLPFVSSRSER